MGLDRFAHFIAKSINNEGIDDLNLNNNIRKIISNHIIFDLNFLIYQEIVQIENEVNDIIKIILCLPFLTDDIFILENYLKCILEQPHWLHYYNNCNLNTIFDGFNEEEIITNFLINITTKNNIQSKFINCNNNMSIIELIIYEKLCLTIQKRIEQIHQPNFIQSILIFLDGIPSFSKVLEQRRRRIKTFLEANERRGLIGRYFDNLNVSNKNLKEYLSKDYLDCKSNMIFDYFKWIKYRFTMDKSIGPSSDFIKYLEIFMNNKLPIMFSKIKIHINGSNENGEADLKIFKYISSSEQNGDYCIHTIDSDLIHQILVQQTYYKIMNKDINLSIIKYAGNSPYEYVQLFEANIIIKKLLELYNTVNNIKTNNYKIIWDICLIFLLFGNDHLPASVEIGPEHNMEYFLKKHYQALNKTNIINLKKVHIILIITLK